IEVLPRRVAPPAVVVGQVGIRRAEIGGGDGDRSRHAPPGIPGARQLVARPAGEPVVEQRRAQGGGIGPVTLTVQVPVSAGAAHGPRGVTPAVKSGVGGIPSE
ncbi:hypothetical protein M569_06510, partial [Genlisea aurea]